MHRLDRCIGAEAVSRQMFVLQPTPSPHGIKFSPSLVQNRTVMLPVESSSQQIKQILDGYLSVRTVMFSSSAGDALRLYESETLELEHARDRVVPAFHSLPPRLCSVTLLYYGTCGITTPKTYLDALAFLASTPIALMPSNVLGANIVRFTVLADYEAQWYAQKVQYESVDSKPSLVDGQVQLCVRWAASVNREPGEKQLSHMRCEFSDLAAGVDMDTALACMQNFMVAMKVHYGAPITDNITVSKPNVTKDAWVTSLHHATYAFVQLMDGVPSVSKSAFLTQYPDIDMDDLEVVVRISERQRGEGGKNHASAFHGFLVGNSAFSEDIKRHCAAYTELPLPSEDTAKFCLHTCAVHTQKLHMHASVSLYSHNGIPGQPFCSGGNWIFCFYAAIVPIEVVMGGFVITPCARELAMPSPNCLRNSYKTYMNRAYELYCSTFGSTRRKRTAFADVDHSKLCPLLPETQPDTQDDLYAKVAFGVDVACKRTRVGDAYTHLVAQEAPQQVTDFLLHSTLRFGVGASVLDSLGMAAKSLMAFTTQAQQQADHEERQRSKRIAEGALITRAKSIRATGTVVRPANARVVANILVGRGVSEVQREVDLPTSAATEKEFMPAVAMLADAILPAYAISNPLLDAACSSAKLVRDLGALHSVASAVTTISVSCVQEKSKPATPVFLLHILKGADKVSIYEILPGGVMSMTTAGVVVDAPSRHVFFVRESDATRGATLMCGSNIKK